MILTLKDNIFNGLDRNAIVINVSSTEIKVCHFVNEDMFWKLPNEVKAGKYYQKWIPFPLIYVCDNIQPGEEFLCLYSQERIVSRGLPCSLTKGDGGIDFDAFQAPWNI